MIKLYQFYPAFDLPNASPFCLKLETYLRMTKLDYKKCYLAYPAKSPTGKLPFVEINGEVLADSGVIICELKRRYGNELDQSLHTLERAQALALQRMIEEHLYWVLVYSRWIDPAGWAIVKKMFFAKLPWPMKLFVPELIRKKVTKQLHACGIGRHAKGTIYQLGVNDLKALADFLGDKLFFFGEQPTSFDACAYAMLANILWAPINSPLKQAVQAYPTFTAYCERMKKRFFPVD